MSKKNMAVKKFYDACIFDIDNVIIDTRASYTDCIRKTVERYLVSTLGYQTSKKSLLNRHDVEQFKLLGGFNDDWDTCYGLLTYFASLTIPSKTIDALIQKKNIALIRKGVNIPMGIKGIEKRFGAPRNISMKQIEKIFQTYYWQTFIKKEMPVIPSHIFSHLKKKGLKIGIATGRSEREANYVLKRYGIRRFVDAMTTLDHVPHAKFKKPHPFSLIEIIKKFGRTLSYIYIGDLPDDVRMARLISNQFKIEGWGFNGLSSSKSETRKSLLKAGATRIIDSPSRLRKILLSF